MTEKILVVEDELVLRETLAYNLVKQGYEVSTAVDGRQAVDMARQTPPDLILLDIMLPKLDGFEVCRLLRRELSTPIIMLTARTDEVDKIVGLEVGADDYLTKPFSMRELLARVKAQLRRVRLSQEKFAPETSTPTRQMRFEDLMFDLDRHEVYLQDKPLALKPKEYELLIYLAQHHGKTLSRDQLLEEVWGWDFSGGSRTVDVHVRWLREKLEVDPAHPTRLVTVRGAGYRFEG
ncbi:MAG TPA: response regulator transcription factor [Anaerolineae bacterium]|nr:response regulator transcription factor [Anaerolineae bacterium]HQH38082.1 response regulator transcription factor [Anaerolineae bacterium]